MTYNGFKNEETWGIAHELTTDEAAHAEIRDAADEIARHTSEHPSVASGEWAEAEAARHELAAYLQGQTGLLSGIGDAEPALAGNLQAGLAEVDWLQIAEAILSEG